MNDNTTTLAGNVVAEPALRATRAGVPVAGFRVAATPRRYDTATGAWKDGETVFMSVTCWRSLAEHVTESLQKGDPVIVTGRLVSRSFETKEGERRQAIEIEATAVGHDLNRGVARLIRTPRPTAATSPPPAPVDPFTGPLADPPPDLVRGPYAEADPAA